MKTGLSLAICVLLFLSSSAQDLILKMSGHEIVCKITEVNDFEVRYEVKNKRGKLRSIASPRSDIFSITQKDSTENIFYSQDSFIGDDFTVQEMRIYIAGEQDALAGYDPRPTTYVGFGLGAAGGYLAEGGLITPLIIPVTYTLFQLVPKVKIREKTITNPNHRYDEIYAMGYESVARSRKVLGGLKGSSIGAVLGVVVYFIVQN